MYRVLQNNARLRSCTTSYPHTSLRTRSHSSRSASRTFGRLRRAFTNSRRSLETWAPSLTSKGPWSVRVFSFCKFKFSSGVADNIEYNITSVATDTSRASEELTTAAEYQRKAGRRAACLMIILVIVVAIVLLAVCGPSFFVSTHSHKPSGSLIVPPPFLVLIHDGTFTMLMLIPLLNYLLVRLCQDVIFTPSRHF